MMRLYGPKVLEHIRKEDLDPDLVSVRYVNGVEVIVPVWLHKVQGHKLVHALSGITSVARNTNELILAFKRTKLVPEELRDVLRAAVGCE